MLESLILEYWQASCKLDSDYKHKTLALIREIAQPVAEEHGYQWTAKVERTLIDAALNYSSSWRKSFMDFFLDRLRLSV